MIRSLADASAFLEGLIDLERRPDAPYARFDLAPITKSGGVARFEVKPS